MLQFIFWYLTITLLGLLTFPLSYRLFPALADRGYSLSRALGLLLWGFLYWLLVSFRILRNDIGGLLFVLALLLGLSVWAVWSRNGELDSTDRSGPVEGWIELWAWLKTHLRVILSVEALFLVAFALWAFVRANNPDTTGTEKPMEIAFINAILHSPTFPPHDPWLSGYAISYYYFGYVLAAMLAMITATNGGMTFNLMLSLVFALSVIGSYGLLYNLLAAFYAGMPITAKSTSGFELPTVQAPSVTQPLLAPVFLVLMGNLEGFLEVLHAYGVGWENTTANFWLWLDMKDLSDVPALPYGWAPRFWFWWRASRILHDYDLRGAYFEIIDEFPFFSYLLGDLHPHVLAMPFGLLAAALALNLYLGGWMGVTDVFGFKIPVRKQGLALMAVVLGGLAFLNTWDFPIYLAVVSGAFILNLVNSPGKNGDAGPAGWSLDLLEDFFRFSIPLALLSIVIYLPFYVGFSSQAGGLLPNVIFPTRAIYLWIMFGTLLVPIFFFLIWMTGKRKADWKTGFLLTIGLVLLLWVFSVVLGIFAGQTEIGRSFITAQGLTSTREVLTAATLRRFQFGGGLLTLVLLIGSALAYFRPVAADPLLDIESEDAAPAVSSAQSPIPFVLMFIVLGGLLVLAPEFVYLRDQFGWRMNTVFKFYYQAWALWSLAAAFGLVVILRELRGIKLVLVSVSATLVLVAGLIYPVLSLPNKTDNFNITTPERRTIDGAAFLGTYTPDDYAAIQWLNRAGPGIVAEAVGGSYSEFARVSTYSGQPSVLGWPGHESQWRGGSVEMSGREQDISRLYSVPVWAEAQAIIHRYDIRYIYIGNLERSTYIVDEQKFAANLSVVYNQGQVVIYEVP